MNLLNLFVFLDVSLHIKTHPPPASELVGQRRETVQCTCLAKEGVCKFFNICHFSTLIIECSQWGENNLCIMQARRNVAAPYSLRNKKKIIIKIWGVAPVLGVALVIVSCKRAWGENRLNQTGLKIVARARNMFRQREIESIATTTTVTWNYRALVYSSGLP